ncbi:Iduronate 2-sulfatase [Mizuhopecten yessoensis]|uniref:Iduronate 2-sulfatase n=1 Tax=Mizuhopecten yessoensis TaxID=6573 RepID=A0A210QAM9_MIZYE|nr:Iduronate 2-sulfatase [Mizuhopecten yessoensis]
MMASMSDIEMYCIEARQVYYLFCLVGWSLGEHQEWSKYSNFEVAVRVPMMVYVPWKTCHSDRANRTRFCSKVSKKISFKCYVCTEGKSLGPLINFVTSNKSSDRITLNSTAFSQYLRPSRTPSTNSDEPSYNQTTIMGYSLTTDDFRYTPWVGFNSSTGMCYLGMCMAKNSTSMEV